MTTDAAELKPFSPIAKVKADGSLLNPDYERVAMRLAEGFTLHEAWEAIGKKAANNDQRKYRNKLLKQGAFKQRVETIMAERDAALAEDDVYGEVKFMCNQLYREAMAVGDIGRLQKAVEMRLQIAKDISVRRGAPPSAPTGPSVEDVVAPLAEEAARPVGRPATEDPQARRSMDDLRTALAARGVKAPKPMVDVQ